MTYNNNNNNGNNNMTIIYMTYNNNNYNDNNNDNNSAYSNHDKVKGFILTAFSPLRNEQPKTNQTYYFLVGGISYFIIHNKL